MSLLHSLDKVLLARREARRRVSGQRALPPARLLLLLRQHLGQFLVRLPAELLSVRPELFGGRTRLTLGKLRLLGIR